MKPRKRDFVLPLAERKAARAAADQAVKERQFPDDLPGTRKHALQKHVWLCHALAHPLIRRAAEYDIKKFKRENAGCWEWTGVIDFYGYGRFCVLGTQYKAHKVSFAMTGGELTRDAPDVLHSCDNPKCFNPAHLRAGSHQENIKDAVNHRYRSMTQSKEQRSGVRKLHVEEVVEILRKYRYRTMRPLGREFRVSGVQASNIIRAAQWKHLVLKYLEDHPAVAAGFFTAAPGYSDTPYYKCFEEIDNQNEP